MASDMSLYGKRFCFKHPQQPLVEKKEPTEAAFPAPNTSFFLQALTSSQVRGSPQQAVSPTMYRHEMSCNSEAR